MFMNKKIILWIKNIFQKLWEVIKSGPFPFIVASTNTLFVILMMGFSIEKVDVIVIAGCFFGILPSILYYYIAYYAYKCNKKMEEINVLSSMIPHVIYMFLWLFIMGVALVSSY